MRVVDSGAMSTCSFKRSSRMSVRGRSSRIAENAPSAREETTTSMVIIFATRRSARDDVLTR